MQKASYPLHNNLNEKTLKKRTLVACFHCRGRKLKCAPSETDSRCQRCVEGGLQCEKGPVGTLPPTTREPAQQQTMFFDTFISPGPQPPPARRFDRHGHSSLSAPYPPPVTNTQLSLPPVHESLHTVETSQTPAQQPITSLEYIPQAPLCVSGRQSHQAHHFNHSGHFPSSALYAAPATSAQPSLPVGHGPLYYQTLQVTAMPSYDMVTTTDDHIHGQECEPRICRQDETYAVPLRPHASTAFDDRDPSDGFPAQTFGQSSATHDMAAAANLDFAPSTHTMWGDPSSWSSMGYDIHDASASTADAGQRSLTSASAEKPWNRSY